MVVEVVEVVIIAGIVFPTNTSSLQATATGKIPASTLSSQIRRMQGAYAGWAPRPTAP